jgi:hypothetical protein|tara:strand:+ start:345 stop:449 length:105 start_codon:yes stop_codon:yes gene_type:complete
VPISTGGAIALKTVEVEVEVEVEVSNAFLVSKTK